jgi:hypothetical protein
MDGNDPFKVSLFFGAAEFRRLQPGGLCISAAWAFVQKAAIVEWAVASAFFTGRPAQRPHADEWSGRPASWERLQRG